MKFMDPENPLKSIIIMDGCRMQIFLGECVNDASFIDAT
jgi:hypothetical protein